MGPAFKLEEQLSDQRSNQIAYKITLENSDTQPIRLQSVVPRVPVGARLLIGALCGIAQDRVLAALKALIGA